MRRILLPALSLFAAFSAACAPICATAQQLESAAEPAPHQVSFNFDPISGVVQATPPAAHETSGNFTPSSPGQGAKTFTGTLDIVLTVKMISAIPQGGGVHCAANAGIEYETVTPATTNTIQLSTGTYLGSQEYVGASPLGGTPPVMTCHFSIPYSWYIPPSTTTTKVTIEGIVGAVGVKETYPETTNGVTTEILFRSTSVELPTGLLLPPEGGTLTTYVYAVL